MRKPAPAIHRIPVGKEFRGNSTSETSHFNLKAASIECVQLISAVAHPSVAIIDRVPPELQMNGDRIQVQQVLINVLRNACEAVEASNERTVVINAIAQDREIIVSVTDTGAGFSPEAALSIFTWCWEIGNTH